MLATLSSDYAVRPLTEADLEAAVALMNTCDEAEIGRPDHPLEEMRAEWMHNSTDPANAGWVVCDAHGQIVAVALIMHQQYVRLNSFVFVHPDHQGHEIGTYLRSLIEEHAQQIVPLAPEGERVALRQYINDANQTAQRMLTEAGYAPIRHFYRMEIVLGDEQPPAEIPAGLEVRPFVVERDAHVVHAAMVESFRDHWGSLPSTFEQWEQRLIKRADFDPSQWFVMWDGDEVAGALIGQHDSPSAGWVGSLGVRRPWRGRGVGMALLRLSFAAFARAGKTSVGLGVDAENPTGAVRLYERAGMHAIYQNVVMEKELRPAADPADASRIDKMQV